MDYSKYLNFTPADVPGCEYYDLAIPVGVVPPVVGDRMDFNGVAVEVHSVSSPEKMRRGRGGPVADEMERLGIGYRVNCLPIGHEWLRTAGKNDKENGHMELTAGMVSMNKSKIIDIIDTLSLYCQASHGNSAVSRSLELKERGITPNDAFENEIGRAEEDLPKLGLTHKQIDEIVGNITNWNGSRKPEVTFKDVLEKYHIAAVKKPTPPITHRMPTDKNLGTIVHKDIRQRDPRRDRQRSKQDLRREYTGSVERYASSLLRRAVGWESNWRLAPIGNDLKKKWNPDVETVIVEVPMERISFAGQPGDYAKEEKAVKFVDAMVRGENFPLVYGVGRENGMVEVIDGHHRTSAWFATGRSSIPIVVDICTVSLVPIGDVERTIDRIATHIILADEKESELPYIELYKKLDMKAKDGKQIEVYIVDGNYIRQEIEEEYTNFGQHYRFQFIPENEFWLDCEYVKNEEEFYIAHLLIEYDLMANKGFTYRDAIVEADKAEKGLRKKTDDFKKVVNPKTKRIDSKRFKKKLWKALEDGTQVWIVDGRLIRSAIDVDFTNGGHDRVYEWVGEDEIYIDDDIFPEERGFVLLHEIHERNQMALGKPYSLAHKESSDLELRARKNPDELHDLLSVEGWS